MSSPLRCRASPKGALDGARRPETTCRLFGEGEAFLGRWPAWLAVVLMSACSGPRDHLGMPHPYAPDAPLSVDLLAADGFTSPLRAGSSPMDRALARRHDPIRPETNALGPPGAPIMGQGTQAFAADVCHVRPGLGPGSPPGIT
jgi:hypothetical protein